MNQPKILFAGTPEFAATHLKALLKAGYPITGVYTQPDRPAGRGRKLQKSPVKIVAESESLALFQPTSLKTTDSQSELEQLDADLMIVVAYGLILPQAVLDAPKLGCINVHASLLPRWRGAAPIHRSLLEGDKHTGVTLMQMEAGLDTGPMLSKADTAISNLDNSGTLHDRLSEIGSKLLVDSLPDILSSRLKPIRQDELQATYAHKLEKHEGLIDWRKTAESIALQIRGLNPWPVAYTQLNDLTVRIWEAEPVDEQHEQPPGTVLQADRNGITISCGTGKLRLNVLQLPGKKAMDAKEIVNSTKNPLQRGILIGN